VGYIVGGSSDDLYQAHASFVHLGEFVNGHTQLEMVEITLWDEGMVKKNFPHFMCIDNAKSGGLFRSIWQVIEHLLHAFLVISESSSTFLGQVNYRVGLLASEFFVNFNVTRFFQLAKVCG
jgi:hypothetical protein